MRGFKDKATSDGHRDGISLGLSVRGRTDGISGDIRRSILCGNAEPLALCRCAPDCPANAPRTTLEAWDKQGKIIFFTMYIKSPLAGLQGRPLIMVSQGIS